MADRAVWPSRSQIWRSDDPVISLTALKVSACQTTQGCESERVRPGGIELTILSRSSNLEEFSIDVGLTYLGYEPIEGMRSEAIYRECR